MQTYRAKTAYQDEATAAHYDARRFTKLKGHLENRLETRAIDEALRLVGPRSTVLDVPCGTLRITELLLRRGLDSVGCDISPAMMKVGMDKVSGQQQLQGLVQADVETMPFADGAFDGVTCIRLMHHLPATIRPLVLAELARVSRRWVIVSYAHLISFQGMRRTLMGGHWGSVPHYAASGSTMRVEAKAAGLEVLRTCPIFKYFSATWILTLVRANDES